MKQSFRIIIATLSLAFASCLTASAQQRDFEPHPLSGNVIMTKQTPGNGLWQLFDGPSIPYSGAMAFTGIISAKAFGNYSASFEVKGYIRNYGGGVAFVGNPTVTVLGRDRASLSLAIDIARSTANGRLQFLVKDELGYSTKWTMALQSAMTVN
jgi:hypothetical protein